MEYIPSQVLTCQVCYKQFESTENYTKHTKEAHAADNLPYNCWICAKEFKNLRQLQRHEKTVGHQINRKEYIPEINPLKRKKPMPPIDIIGDNYIEFLEDLEPCEKKTPAPPALIPLEGNCIGDPGGTTPLPDKEALSPPAQTGPLRRTNPMSHTHLGVHWTLRRHRSQQGTTPERSLPLDSCLVTSWCFQDHPSDHLPWFFQGHSPSCF